MNEELQNTSNPGPGPGVPIRVPEPPGPDLIPDPTPDPEPPEVQPSPDPQIPPDPQPPDPESPGSPELPDGDRHTSGGLGGLWLQKEAAVVTRRRTGEAGTLSSPPLRPPESMPAPSFRASKEPPDEAAAPMVTLRRLVLARLLAGGLRLA
jgi:hypothetical protein